MHAVNLDPDATLRLDDAPLFEFLKQFVTTDRLDRFEQALQRRTRALTVVLEHVDKPHNASAVIRSCEAFGLQDLHLPGFTFTKHKIDRQISTKAGRWMNLIPTPDHSSTDEQRRTGIGEYYRKLRQQGYTIVATTPSSNSVSLHEFELTQPTALIFGAELRGLSEEAIAEADQRVHIQLPGLTRSINLSVSVALCLFQLRPLIDQLEIDTNLPPNEIEQLRRLWIRHAIGPGRIDAYLRRFDASSHQE